MKVYITDEGTILCEKCLGPEDSDVTEMAVHGEEKCESCEEIIQATDN